MFVLRFPKTHLSEIKHLSIGIEFCNMDVYIDDINVKTENLRTISKTIIDQLLYQPKPDAFVSLLD